jgi:carbamoyl-phosphate synthase large subunit
VNKVQEGSPHIVDLIHQGKIQLIINTTSGKEAIRTSFPIRRAALLRNIPYFTTIPGAYAGVSAIAWMQKNEFSVKTVQDYYQKRPRQLKFL